MRSAHGRFCIFTSSVIGVLFAWAIPVAHSPAEEPGRSPEQETWVKKLGDRTFAFREEAYRQLLKQGIESPEAVLEALPEEGECRDFEVLSACRRLREQILDEVVKRLFMRKFEGNPEVLKPLTEAPAAHPIFLNAPASCEVSGWKKVSGFFLHHKDPAVRLKAVRSFLQEIGRAPCLLAVFEDTHAGVLQEAIGIFGALVDGVPDPGIAAEIARFLAPERSSEVRQAALQALVRMKLATNVELIKPLLSDGDELVRKVAREAIDEILAPPESEDEFVE